MNARNPTAGGILADGLWWNTPGLASLLGLCPLLAATRTFEAGVALGLASLLVLCTSNVLVSALGGWIPPRLRVPAFLVLIAALVTAVDLDFQARWLDVHGQVGLFVPLIVTNCVILTRAESAAAHRNGWHALLDGLGYGISFMLLLGGLGALREWLAPGLLVAALPPGAFFLLAGLVALRQSWRQRQAAT
ncbi:MAG: Rnf-Nqr domain containing protein [Gammaproteobacteria bacterium]